MNVHQASNSEDLLKEAVSAFEADDFGNCIIFLNKAIEINHNGELSDILYYYRALTHVELGLANKAINDLDTAVFFNDQKKHYSELRLELKMSLLWFKEAMSDIENMLKSDPQNELALLNKGIVLQESGQIQPAIDVYSLLLNVNPENKAALYLRGMIYLQNAMADKGCADIQLAAKLGFMAAKEALSRYCK